MFAHSDCATRQLDQIFRNMRDQQSKRADMVSRGTQQRRQWLDGLIAAGHPRRRSRWLIPVAAGCAFGIVLSLALKPTLEKAKRERIKAEAADSRAEAEAAEARQKAEEER